MSKSSPLSSPLPLPLGTSHPLSPYTFLQFFPFFSFPSRLGYGKLPRRVPRPATLFRSRDSSGGSAHAIASTRDIASTDVCTCNCCSCTAANSHGLETRSRAASEETCVSRALVQNAHCAKRVTRILAIASSQRRSRKSRGGGVTLRVNSLMRMTDE